MRLERTRIVLEKSQAVVSSAALEQDVFANYLTEYILIIFYSEFEEAIKIIIGDVLKSSSNENIADFLTTTLDTIIKRIDKRDLCKTLVYFGEDKKSSFIAEVDASIFSKYQSFLNNRHNVAHAGKAVEVSWTEVQKIAEIGETVLSSFKKSLEVNNA
jgi:hypothetical protein